MTNNMNTIDAAEFDRLFAILAKGGLLTRIEFAAVRREIEIMTRKQLREILGRPETSAATREAVRRQLNYPTPTAPSCITASPLEERFLSLWKSMGGPELEREYRFDPSRRFRFDFAHLGSMVAVELDGATEAGVRGGHTSKAGYRAGCEKGNAALLLGWRMFRLTASMITAQHVQPIIDLTK